MKIETRPPRADQTAFLDARTRTLHLPGNGLVVSLDEAEHDALAHEITAELVNGLLGHSMRMTRHLEHYLDGLQRVSALLAVGQNAGLLSPADWSGLRSGSRLHQPIEMALVILLDDLVRLDPRERSPRSAFAPLCELENGASDTVAVPPGVATHHFTALRKAFLVPAVGFPGAAPVDDGAPLKAARGYQMGAGVPVWWPRAGADTDSALVRLQHVPSGLLLYLPWPLALEIAHRREPAISHLVEGVQAQEAYLASLHGAVQHFAAEVAGITPESLKGNTSGFMILSCLDLACGGALKNMKPDALTRALIQRGVRALPVMLDAIDRNNINAWLGYRLSPAVDRLSEDDTLSP